MTNQQSEVILDDVLNWLFDCPSRDDILYYVKRVPEEGYRLVSKATQRAAFSLDGQKNAFFGTCFPGFVRVMSDAEQFSWINYFTVYSPSSVVKNLQKRFPDIGDPLPTSDLKAWSVRYLAEWESVFLFGSCPEFLRVHTYARLLAARLYTDEQLEQYISFLDGSAVATAESFRKGTDAKAWEKDRMGAEFLRKLSIFTDEYLHLILTPERTELRIGLYQDIARVFSFMHRYGAVKAHADPDRFISSIWNQLKELAEIKFLGDRTAQWVADRKADLEELFVQFMWLWQVEPICSGKTAREMTWYIQRLTAEQRSAFPDYFERLFLESSVVSVMLEPSDPEQVLAKIIVAVRNRKANEFLASILPDFPEERKRGVSALLTTVISIYQSLLA